MSELRLYLRRDFLRDSLRDGSECPWVLRDGLTQGVINSGTSLANLPKAAHCRLILAADLVTLVRAPLPNLPDRKLQPLLASAAEAYSLSEAEQLHVALMRREADATGWLALVDKPWLKRVLARLKELGIQPDSALPEGLLLPWRSGHWSVLWNEDGAIARLGEANTEAFDTGEPPAGLLLAKQQGESPAAIDLWLGSALHAAKSTQWKAALGIPVEEKGRWDWRTAPWPQGAPNLLQGALAPTSGRIDWKSLRKPVALGIAALASIQVIGLGIDTLLLNKEQRSIQQQIRNLAEKALPAHASIVDPAWQVSEQLKQSRVRQDRSPDSFSSLSNLLAKAWPEAGAAKVESLAYDAGQLTVTLARPDPNWLLQLESNLRAAGLGVNKLNSAPSSTNEPDKVQLSLTATRPSQENHDGR